ncbi:MAG: glutaredoxin 3 [Rickettsiales bacterium]|nr:glutaredoxin 3 [Rickettsiales bacterium]
MAKIEVYSTNYCPYCVRAKDLLKRKGQEFDEIDVTDDMALREKLVEKAGGRRTVPQIFIDDQLIGGFDDLDKLNKSGRLDDLL